MWAASKSKEPPNIFVKVLGAGNPVPLLKPTEGIAHVLPTWSPDGRFIACVRAVQLMPPVADPKSKMTVAEALMNETTRAQT